jgi:hypothetical protein
LCIYHGFCADGFTAAWVVWKWYDVAILSRTHGDKDIIQHTRCVR